MKERSASYSKPRHRASAATDTPRRPPSPSKPSKVRVLQVHAVLLLFIAVVCIVIKKASPYTITERRIPELIPVLGSQLAGDVSHKPGGTPR